MTFQWTAEMLAGSAEEHGVDPEKFAYYLNETEKYTQKILDRRRKEDYKSLEWHAKLARECGLITAAEGFEAEIDRMNAWDAWRKDPNAPYPGF